MLKYELIRVDDRLIHGQVLIKWMKVLNVKRVVVLSDDLDADPIMKALMKQTIPSDMKLDIWNLKAGIENIYKENGEALILLQDVNALYELFENGIQIKRVSISRLPCEQKKEKICEHVFVSMEERKKLGILLNRGVDIKIQPVPDSEAIDLRNLL